MTCKCLKLRLSGSCFDIYAGDVFYLSFYIRFIHLTSKNKSDCDFSIEKIVMNIFYSYVMIKIVYKKDTYLLHELLRDVTTISDLGRLAEPKIKHKSKCKDYLNNSVIEFGYSVIRLFRKLLLFFP